MSIRRVVPIEQADWSISPPPAWVIAREVDWEFAPPDPEGVAVLLYDEQHDVATQSVSFRGVRRPLTHAAVQSLGQVEVDFDPGAHRLRIHEIAVWRRDAGGKWRGRSAAKRENLLLRQREQGIERQMLNGRVSVFALIEDLQVGDAIEVAWTLEPREPLPGLKFTRFFAFAWTVPLGRAYLSLRLDPASPVRWVAHIPDGVARPAEESGAERATWSVERPAKLVPEPNAPGSHWPFALIDVSGWTSWGEVADFVAALWSDALAEGEETVAAEAARIREQHAGPGLVRAAIRFVQEEVRYLAVDFGHGAGMLPNGAGAVLRRRFGDCKDKSVLLTALLRALGFEAWPLLVAPNWRTAVARLQPSPAVFSHAIVTFVSEGGRFFVDPTFVGQGGDLPHLAPPPYGCGLEVRAGATEFVTLPDPPLADLSLTETFHLDRKHRRGSVEQVLRADGPMADDVRAALVRQGRGAFLKARTEALQRHFPALVGDDAAAVVNDDVARNVIELRARYALPTWGPAAERPPRTFQYGAHGLSLAIERVEGPEERKQPWSLRHPLRVHHRVIVSGKCVQQVMEGEYRFSGPGFRYTCQVQPSREEVTFDYRWETTGREVSALEWPAYCRERARAFERAGIIVPTEKPRSAAPQTWNWVWVLPMFVMVSTIVRELSGLGERDGGRSARPSVGAQVADFEIGAARNAIYRGNYAEAADLLAKAQSGSAQSFDFQAVYAETAIHAGRFDVARRAIDAARRIDPTSLLTDRLDSSLHRQLGDLAAARRDLERLLVRAPEDPRALVGLGQVAQQLGDTAVAQELLERVLARYPADPDAVLSHALLLWDAGERERADAAIAQALDSQPPASSAALEGSVADYYSATGRPAEALASARRAVALASGDPGSAHRHALALLRTGDVGGALAAARQMNVRFPNHALALSALATVAVANGDRDLAANTFRTWLAIAPGDADAKADYGAFLVETGRSTEARAWLEQATRDSPGAGPVWFRYAKVLEGLGDREAAAGALRKANELTTPAQRASLLAGSN